MSLNTKPYIQKYIKNYYIDIDIEDYLYFKPTTRLELDEAIKLWFNNKKRLYSTLWTYFFLEC